MGSNFLGNLLGLGTKAWGLGNKAFTAASSLNSKSPSNAFGRVLGEGVNRLADSKAGQFIGSDNIQQGARWAHNNITPAIQKLADQKYVSKFAGKHLGNLADKFSPTAGNVVRAFANNFIPFEEGGPVPGRSRQKYGFGGSILGNIGGGFLGNLLGGETGRSLGSTAGKILGGFLPFEEGGSVPGMNQQNPNMTKRSSLAALTQSYQNDPRNFMCNFGGGRQPYNSPMQYRPQQRICTSGSLNSSPFPVKRAQGGSLYPTNPSKRYTDAAYGSGGAIFANGAGGASKVMGPQYTPKRGETSFWDVVNSGLKLAPAFFAEGGRVSPQKYAKGGRVSARKKAQCKFEGHAQSSKTQSFLNCFK